MKMNMTITDIKRNNKKAGLHFFCKETMRFFNSRIETALYKDNTFITSEQFDYKSPRGYTIRKAVDCGKSYFESKKLITGNYNLYSNTSIDDEKFTGVYPLIEESFLSSDYKEYCNECEKKIN